MSDTDGLVSEILEVHRHALDLQEQQRDTADRRAELIRQAMAAGAGATTIAEALGVNRQRVYAMAKGGH